MKQFHDIIMQQDLALLFARLRGSKFRSSFSLRGKDLNYLQAKGLPVVLEHATDFVAKRLFPANPANDGKQTPFRGHPVFVAQHATATCCRGCLEKWHGIERGQELSAQEQQYIVHVIEMWLLEQVDKQESAGIEVP